MNKEQIWKDIQELDIQIRTIKIPEKKDKDKTFYVEVGLFESLGERGDILTEIYKLYPTEETIIEDVRIYLKELKEDLENYDSLSGREEEHLKVLNKISKGLEE
ncbi:MAG TPA: hypothetical protein ENG87_02500 [Candidatus Pacearchaeota archaeon]|nr:hypothetical protein BMS3Abin17_00623 [archaeon BMS3Abin17]HDK42225.1 hypothetical protein [Candidatus Pacearchaeota archaeon]HDZ60184.1 hypothetical protein [Candidatus Pacearchaeota archaeon]